MSNANINEQEIEMLVLSVLASRDIATLKASIEALMRLYSEAESMHGYIIRERFFSAVKKRAEAHQRKTQGLKCNAVIIPPESTPTAMIPIYLNLAGNHYDFIDGINRLISRCDELVAPVYPAVTEKEIRATLSAAQRAFKMIDIIAPDYPLRIYRFDYAHTDKNSECAILNGDDRQSVIFSFHPREKDAYDRIFIFAHELGHALHYALTGDVSIAPNGFDRLNATIGVKLDTPKVIQESFADATAIAILGSSNSRLKSHLPTQFCKDLSPMFVRYFMSLCAAGRA